MVWPLALRPDDAKQDPVVYGTKFGVVFLAEGPRTASIQKGITIRYILTSSACGICNSHYSSFFPVQQTTSGIGHRVKY